MVSRGQEFGGPLAGISGSESLNTGNPTVGRVRAAGAGAARGQASPAFLSLQ